MKWVGLPGMDGTGRLFAPLQQHVELTAVAYPDRAASYEELEEWLRDQLPSEPFGLLAESFSGPLGLRIAADPPESLRALVLVATFGRSPVPLLPGAHLWSRPAFFTHPPRWAIRALLVGSDAPASLVEQVQSVLRGVSAATMAARAEAIRTVDVRGLTPRVPALHLVADADRLVRRRFAEELGVPLRELAGPHLLCQREPGSVAAALSETAAGWLRRDVPG